MYISLKAVNCSAPAVSSTSSYDIRIRTRRQTKSPNEKHTLVNSPSTSSSRLYSSGANHISRKVPCKRKMWEETFNCWIIRLDENSLYETASECGLANASRTKNDCIEFAHGKLHAEMGARKGLRAMGCK